MSNNKTWNKTLLARLDDANILSVEAVNPTNPTLKGNTMNSMSKRYVIIGGVPFTKSDGTTIHTSLGVVASTDVYEEVDVLLAKNDLRCASLLIAIDRETGLRVY